MKKPYLIETIIGNTKVLGQLDSNGILQRFYWPAVDYYQQIKQFLAAIFLDGLVFFEDEKFKVKSGFLDDFAYFFAYKVAERRIFQVDFVDCETDALIRFWETDFKDFYVFFEPMINSSILFNAAKVDKENEIIYVYFKGTYIGLAFENEIDSYTLNNGISDAYDNQLEGGNDATKPQIAVRLKNTGRVVCFLAIGNSKDEVYYKLSHLKQKDYNELYNQNKAFWEKKFSKVKPIITDDFKDIELQKRSAYVFYTMQNSKTGGILAASEVDEEFSHCGGYGFVWGRDAAFIAAAMDALGLSEEVDKFFEFKFSCQEKEGFWDQRYYTDGTLAPSWGVQIDETASIVWGFLNHCEKQKSLQLLDSYKEQLKKAIQFLMAKIDNENGVIFRSFDLWEERDGIHLYSNASIYAALKKAKSYFPELEKEIERKLMAIKNQTFTAFYSSKLLRYVRSTNVRVSREEFLNLHENNRYIQKDEKYEITYYFKKQDEVVDVAMLGIYYPFEMISNNDEAFKNTVLTIEKECLNTIVGGYMRYSNDRYIGGNPWILTTLWLAIYYKKTGQIDKAGRLFEWTKTCSLPNGFLPEQVDRITGKPAWIVPLAWSHAMYVLYLNE